LATEPSSPYVLRVYVNGLRRDLAGQGPLAVLRNIPSNGIAEMYYADCHDDVVRIHLRYSIFVALHDRSALNPCAPAGVPLD